MNKTPPVCNYEGSDYQKSFWEQGGREYEDLVESIALKRLLPKSGRLMLELGAGAGRNTPRYSGFDRIVLLDYSTTQLAQAQERLGHSSQFIFVAADIYRLPFADHSFDAATMIRALHHLVDAPQALGQVRKALQPGAAFILEFANKRNLKSILRFWAGKQTWNPFTPEPVEFAELNFDFHPKTVRRWLKESCFGIEKILTVSHFRLGILKRLIPARWLALLDGLLQPTGNAFQLTPSVFIRARSQGGLDHANTPLTILELFKCPDCGAGNLQDRENHLACPQCHAQWAVHDGIYDFRAKE